ITRARTSEPPCCALRAPRRPEGGCTTRILNAANDRSISVVSAVREPKRMLIGPKYAWHSAWARGELHGYLYSQRIAMSPDEPDESGRQTREHSRAREIGKVRAGRQPS